jgi:hypothetical protein
MPENLCPERAQKTRPAEGEPSTRPGSDLRLGTVLFLAGCSSAEPVALQTVPKSSSFFPFCLFLPNCPFIRAIWDIGLLKKV